MTQSPQDSHPSDLPAHSGDHSESVPEGIVNFRRFAESPLLHNPEPEQPVMLNDEGLDTQPAVETFEHEGFWAILNEPASDFPLLPDDPALDLISPLETYGAAGFGVDDDLLQEVAEVRQAEESRAHTVAFHQGFASRQHAEQHRRRVIVRQRNGQSRAWAMTAFTGITGLAIAIYLLFSFPGNEAAVAQDDPFAAALAEDEPAPFNVVDEEPATPLWDLEETAPMTEGDADPFPQAEPLPEPEEAAPPFVPFEEPAEPTPLPDPEPEPVPYDPFAGSLLPPEEDPEPTPQPEPLPIEEPPFPEPVEEIPFPEPIEEPIPEFQPVPQPEPTPDPEPIPVAPELELDIAEATYPQGFEDRVHERDPLFLARIDGTATFGNEGEAFTRLTRIPMGRDFWAMADRNRRFSDEPVVRTKTNVERVPGQSQVRFDTVIEGASLDLQVKAPEEMRVGETSAIRLVVHNNGDSAARKTVIRADLPAGLDHPAGRELDYLVGDLPAGETHETVLYVTATTAGVAMNDLQVLAVGGIASKSSAPITIKPSEAAPQRRALPTAPTFRRPNCNCQPTAQPTPRPPQYGPLADRRG